MTGRLARFVLLANAWLIGRSGTEIVTRDYALGLERRGWRVAIWSPKVGGPVAEELAGRVELVSDLAALDRAPDVIHGHQHPVLVPALARFPDTPAIQLCHDAGQWFDEALAFDQVVRHAAVNGLCHRRVARETGLDAEQIAVLPNAVDLERCRARPPLPRRARRVLIVAHHGAGHVAPALAACERAGLETATVGFAVGRPSFKLEAEMAAADIVVGAARIALEAMAVGCAVVVADPRGVAGMAGMATFEAWRLDNFGGALLNDPPTPESIGAALAAYDPDDAMAVSERVRQTCGLEPAIDRLEALYAEVLAEHRAAGPFDRARQAQQLGAYLQRFLAVDVALSPWGKSYETLSADLNLASTRLDTLVRELGQRGIKISFGPSETAPPTEAGG